MEVIYGEIILFISEYITREVSRYVKFQKFANFYNLLLSK